MGTSSSYGGPGRSGSLLPPWAVAVGSDAQAVPATTTTPGESPQAVPAVAPVPSQPAPTVTWSTAKGRLTRFASSGGTGSRGGRERLRKALSGYVKAQGGSRAASRNAVAGRRSTQSLGGFLGALVSSGATKALQSIGLASHVGSDAMTLLGALVDRLSSDGHSLEANVARSALTKTLHALFEARGVTDGGLATLDSMSQEDAKLAICEYVARYIDERLLQVLGDGLQALPVDEIVQREANVWDYIRNRVTLDLTDLDVLSLDWASAQAATLVDEIFTDAHRMIQLP